MTRSLPRLASCLAVAAVLAAVPVAAQDAGAPDAGAPAQVAQPVSTQPLPMPGPGQTLADLPPPPWADC